MTALGSVATPENNIRTTFIIKNTQYLFATSMSINIHFFDLDGMTLIETLSNPLYQNNLSPRQIKGSRVIMFAGA